MNIVKVSRIITGITYDASSELGNILVTITFASRVGETYTAFVDSDLETPLSEKFIANDNIVGEDGTTTFVIDFDAIDFDTTVSQFFIVIAENTQDE